VQAATADADAPASDEETTELAPPDSADDDTVTGELAELVAETDAEAPPAPPPPGRADEPGFKLSFDDER
jgi:hypothetical protein